MNYLYSKAKEMAIDSEDVISLISDTKAEA
jgi:hypothetical protein